MKKFKEQYTRLPGRSKPMSFWVRQSRQHLYLAEDHILVVSPGTYSEESYRIALGDVQAVTMNKTNEFIISNLLYFVIMFAWAALYFFFASFSEMGEDDQIVLAIMFLFFGIPILILFLYNLFLGPTCKCVLRTAVKQHHLSSLGRLRSAKKAIAMIAQAAYAQQGNFAAVEEEEQTTNEHESTRMEDNSISYPDNIQ